MEAIFFSALSDIPIMSLVAIGFFISLRLMRFPDLSVDASYMMGMAVVGQGVAQQHVSEVAMLPVSFLVGALVGVMTGVLHTAKIFGLSKLLSGLLVSFAAYSICYRMIDHTASLSLYSYREDMYFYWLIGRHSQLLQAAASLLGVGFMFWLVVRVLSSNFGFALRASAHNKHTIQTLGIGAGAVTLCGLALSNGVVSLGGWLYATNNYNVPLQNFGMVIHALASVISGELIFFTVLKWSGRDLEDARTRIPWLLSIPIIGAVFYSFLKAIVISLLSGELRHAITTDFQLVLAMAIIVIVAVSRHTIGEIQYERDDAF